jgi:4-amino-4-deoxy-L-arabinose transferase-like glycosyltransferase
MRRRGEIGLLLLCLFLFFWRLGAARLFDMDEGFYVTCARQMVVTGDYVTPRLNVRPHDRPNETTVPFYEKPILTYWASAAALRVFGNSEGAARLPVACASLAATFLIVWAGTRWIGRRAALIAGLVYATAPMVVLDGRQMTTDALLTLWFLIAMAAHWERRPLLFSTACAFGVLTKGIIGLLLPLLVLGVLHTVRVVSAGWHGQPFSWVPRLSRRDWLRLVLSGALFLVIAVPWHIAILKAGGHDANGRTWVQEYIIRQHLGRFKGLDSHHNAPIFTYFGYFLIGFFPWACFTPFAFRFPPRRDELAVTCAPRPNDRPTETRRFLLCWFWTVFGFFSLSAAKLPTYIVPAYPAAALMVGHWLERVLKKSRVGHRGDRHQPRAARAGGMRAVAKPTDEVGGTTGDPIGGDPSYVANERLILYRQLYLGTSVALGTATLLLIAALLVPAVTRSHPVMPEAIAELTVILTLVTALGCLAAWLCMRRASRGAGWALAGIWSLAGTITLLIGLVAGPGYRVVNRWLLSPYQDLAILARPDAHRGAAVVYYDIGDRRPSMLYYARDYSPLERKEEDPLLPFLERYLPADQTAADVVTLRRAFDSHLRQELDTAHWGVEMPGMRDSGLDTWILLRIHRSSTNTAPLKRPAPPLRHTTRRIE